MMKHLKYLSILSALAAGLALLLTVIMQPAAAYTETTTRYVAPGGHCGGASPCYATIQAAVDAADPGDEIKVAEGTYRDLHARGSVTQTVYIERAISLRGGYAPADWSAADPVAHPTILDARGKGRALYITGPVTVTITGFYITGGNAAGLGGSWRGDVGGGIFLENVRGEISNNRIFGNVAEVGAGLFLNKSPVTLVANGIYNNVASNAGGGMDVTHSGVTFIRNSIYNNHGGGLNLGWSDILMYRNSIRNNTGVWRGGGLYFWDCDATLVNNLILGNKANQTGSGIFADAGSNLRMLHTTIARNESPGSGVYVNTYGEFPSTVMMTNTILADHTAGIEASAGSTATLTSTLWHGNNDNWRGVGVIHHTQDYTGDPKFAFDGYHLSPGSVALDKGVNGGIVTDIDGDARPYGPGYDIGADEYNGVRISPRKLYLPLALGR